MVSNTLMFNDFVGLASKVMVEDGTSLNNKIPLELLFGSLSTPHPKKIPYRTWQYYPYIWWTWMLLLLNIQIWMSHMVQKHLWNHTLLESSPNLVLNIHHMPSSEMLELLLVIQVLFSNNECSKKKRIGQCPHVYVLEEDSEDKFLWKCWNIRNIKWKFTLSKWTFQVHKIW